MPVPPYCSGIEAPKKPRDEKRSIRLSGNEQILAVDVLRDRGDLVAREVARGLAREHRHVVAQIEVVDAQRCDRAPPQPAHARLVEAGAHRRAQLGVVERVRGSIDAEVVA